MFRRNLLSFILGPLPLVLSLGYTEKSLAPFPLYPPFRYACTLMRSPLHLLFSRLNSPSSQPVRIGGMILSLNHLRVSSLDSLQSVDASFALGNLELN